jgi:DNA repair photolyase
MISSLWNRPATIERNNFKYKSLSSWSYNVAVGCAHACRFCYVPQASTIRLTPKLKALGVEDPDTEWGDYVFPRMWDINAFMASLRAAESTPLSELNPDGNRAVMFCTTTDPFQTLPDKELHQQLANNTSCALYWIRRNSKLNVRILTRSPLARRDFDLMKEFGNRLLFGMSIPTLNNQLARIYEPHAPAPTQRLATLRAAKEAGLNIYVAVAPTYPECDAADMRATLTALKELDPVTIFMEPINIRAENVSRIATHAESLGVKLRTEVFATPQAWRDYAIKSLLGFEAIATNLGLADRIHLWPDASLGTQVALKDYHNSHLMRGFKGLNAHHEWLQSHWTKVSAWPK